jgi:hypothetical protein
MWLSGWAVIFNLWMLALNEPERTYIVGYPDDVGDFRPMSPKLTTGILTFFWLQAAVLVASLAR